MDIIRAFEASGLAGVTNINIQGPVDFTRNVWGP